MLQDFPDSVFTDMPAGTRRPHHIELRGGNVFVLHEIGSFTSALLFQVLSPSRTIRSELCHSDASIDRKGSLLLITELRLGRSLLIEPGPELVLTPERVARQMGITQNAAAAIVPLIEHVARHIQHSEPGGQQASSKPVPAIATRVSVYTVWEAHWEKHRRAPGCCAPGCGDKIKPGCDETCFEITWSDSSVSHLEEGCVEWFIDGHPDYGHGYGTVPGLR